MQKFTPELRPCSKCGDQFKQRGPKGTQFSWCITCTREANKTAPKKDRCCRYCSKSFSPTSRNHWYCSDYCARWCPKCQPPRTIGNKRVCDSCKAKARSCFQCGESFIAKAGNQNYCSEECRCWARDARQKGKRPTTAVCLWCFVEFEFRLNKPYCSIRCRNASINHIKQHRSPNTCSLATCVDCLEVFSASLQETAARKNRCKSCFISWAKSRNLSRWKKRDARRRGAMQQGDRIDAVELAHCFNWVCHLCYLPINADLKWPHSGSLSIDHLIPLTPYKNGDQPGTHTWGNVRPAHLGCNSRRGNRPLAQAS